MFELFNFLKSQKGFRAVRNDCEAAVNKILVKKKDSNKLFSFSFLEQFSLAANRLAMVWQSGSVCSEQLPVVLMVPFDSIVLSSNNNLPSFRRQFRSGN